MKIISINIRGLRGSVKCKYIKDLIWNEQGRMVCIQETESNNLDLNTLFLLWGTNEIGWVENKAIQSAGGLITMWRKNYFEMTGYINGTSYNIIEGNWKEGVRSQITVVNVYGFGTLCDKKQRYDKNLWK